MSTNSNARKPSPKLSLMDAIEIQKRLKRREFLHRIPADYDVNLGRIAKIKTGMTFKGSYEAAFGTGAQDSLF